jgi:hypothetical protein
MDRINTKGKPTSWRKRFKRATREDEDIDRKKDKLIDIEMPKNGSSPISGEPKDTWDQKQNNKVDKMAEEEKVQ